MAGILSEAGLMPAEPRNGKSDSAIDCFGELAANPRLGRERDDVKAGYRSFPQGRHVVFYGVASAAIEVIGIVHQSADVDAHLGEPPNDG